jgi:hypothetical protein
MGDSTQRARRPTPMLRIRTLNLSVMSRAVWRARCRRKTHQEEGVDEQVEVGSHHKLAGISVIPKGELPVERGTAEAQPSGSRLALKQARMLTGCVQEHPR